MYPVRPHSPCQFPSPSPDSWQTFYMHKKSPEAPQPGERPAVNGPNILLPSLSKPSSSNPCHLAAMLDISLIEFGQLPRGSETPPPRFRETCVQVIHAYSALWADSKTFFHPELLAFLRYRIFGVPPNDKCLESFAIVLGCLRG